MNSNRTIVLTAVLVVLVLISMAALTAHARTPEGQEATEGRVALARQAFAAGDAEEAERLYQEVLDDDPDNERAFWGLVQVYSSTDRIESHLIPMLERRLGERPNDRQVAMELAEAYARSGDHVNAHERWSDILNDSRANVSDYADIGSAEVRHRMYEQALDTFLSGRARFRSESLFSQELVTVYAALGDFDSAITECILTVNEHGGAVQWATNRIEMLLEAGAERSLVLDRMSEVTGSNRSTVAELSFAGSVYLALDIPDRALDAFLEADDRAGGRGEQLLECAALLRDDGRPEQARAAYLMVVERHPGESAAARAGISAAVLLAESGDAAGAVAELRAVSDKYASSAPGAQAIYEAARIELDQIKDPAAALATVAEMRSKFGQRAQRFEDDAALIEIDAYMMRGLFEDAHARAGALLHDGVRQEVRDRAAFALGLSSFLRHDDDAALEEFRNMILENASGEQVNDGLRLMLVIATAQESGVMEPVHLLADARAASIAGDDALAEGLLESVVSARTSEAVEAEALLLLAGMASARGDDDLAIERYDSVIHGIEALTPRAEAMMRKADVLTRRGERRDAMDQYLALIEELPDNVLSGEARRKLDLLRRGEGGGGS